MTFNDNTFAKLLELKVYFHFSFDSFGEIKIMKGKLRTWLNKIGYQRQRLYPKLELVFSRIFDFMKSNIAQKPHYFCQILEENMHVVAKNLHFP